MHDPETCGLRSDKHFEEVALCFPTRLKVHTLTAASAFPVPLGLTLPLFILKLEQLGTAESRICKGRQVSLLHFWLSEHSVAQTSGQGRVPPF